ncbi:hypothetical protein IWW50_000155 [Coemansia erecta]|nr:hypothetical protein IWW50_000155 [Coemansia erecta]
MKWMALQGNMYSLEEDLQDAHEDNKLLQDKVTDLETKLALKMSRVDMLQAEIDRMAKISLAHKTHIRSLQVNLASKKELLREFGHYY